MSLVFICNSILFSRLGLSSLPLFWNIFQIDSLSSPLLFGLVGFYHAHSPAGYFSAFSFCLLCCVCGLLSASWGVIVPLNCEACSLWLGFDQWLVKTSWLGKLLSVFWWVELDLVYLEGSTVSSGESWCVTGFGIALGNMSLSVQGCVPVLLEDYCEVSCTAAWWLLGWSLVSVYVWRLFGGLLSINVSWGQEFYDGPKFWSWASCLWVSLSLIL